MSTPPLAKRSRTRRIVLYIVLALVAIRVALPFVLLHLLNDRLKSIPGYHGNAEDLDLALIRGAYRIENVFLDRVDSTTQERTPFIGAGSIDLSVEWKALFHGAVVGELVIEHAQVNFTKDKAEPAQVQGDTTSLGDLLQDLMPLRINRVEVHRGEVHYLDPTSSPKVDLRMDHVELLALNLRNSYDSSVVLPASLRAEAAINSGRFTLNMALNPLEASPTFDLDLALTDVRLPELNDFFQAYANVDVNRGTFGLYAEIATKERRFAGYVKPIVHDLDVVGPEDKDDTVFRKLWEGIAGTAGAILTNPREDQVATKLEFSGRLDEPIVHSWYAIIDLIRNAFIRALQPTIDREISIGNVGRASEREKGFFKRLFNKDDQQRPKKRKP
ncbi:MAG: DUF748 domain-containing protein [Flavobacteriales bacterium]